MLICEYFYFTKKLHKLCLIDICIRHYSTQQKAFHWPAHCAISTWLRQRQGGTLLSAGTVGTKTAIPLLVENDLVDIIVFLSDCGQNMDRDAVRDLVNFFRPYELESDQI